MFNTTACAQQNTVWTASLALHVPMPWSSPLTCLTNEHSKRCWGMSSHGVTSQCNTTTDQYAGFHAKGSSIGHDQTWNPPTEASPAWNTTGLCMSCAQALLKKLNYQIASARLWACVVSVIMGNICQTRTYLAHYELESIVITIIIIYLLFA